MRPFERQKLIVEHVEEQGRVTVEALAAALDVSRETVRRDLSVLAGHGRVRKVHGGASAIGSGGRAVATEGPFQARMGENVAGKRAVARTAAGLFRPGDTLLVDTGSTTVFLAEELARLSGLTVITNSVLVAQRVAAGEGHRTFLIGGDYRDATGATVGPLAADQIRSVKTAHVVLTIGGIDVDGIADFDPEEAEIARAMLAQGRRLTVVADTSKLGRTATFAVCDLTRVSRIVLDATPPDPLRRAFASAGIEVILADGGEPPSSDLR